MRQSCGTLTEYQLQYNQCNIVNCLISYVRMHIVSHGQFPFVIGAEKPQKKGLATRD